MSFTKLCISVLLLLASTTVLAKGAQPQIAEVFVDTDNNQLVISGSGFDSPDVSVSLGGYPDFLILNTDLSTEEELVVDLPGIVGAGDYKLTVSQGRKGKNQDDYDLTIGAVGPPGEQGFTGPSGQVGPRGPEGLSGTDAIATRTFSVITSSNLNSGDLIENDIYGASGSNVHPDDWGIGEAFSITVGSAIP